ncbi:MAG: DUF2796 domain-containing protein [Lautropia sp.]|nr:DUF2796 domain-containing protein [Lautropia sp.]
MRNSPSTSLHTRPTPRRTSKRILLATTLLVAGPPAAAAGIHQHGLASLELSQQDGTVIVQFRSPLDNLIGFESRPANDQQRTSAKQLLKSLQHDSARIFVLPAAARCTQSQPPKILAKALASVTKPGTGHGHEPGHDHDQKHGRDHGHGKTAHRPDLAGTHAHDDDESRAAHTHDDGESRDHRHEHTHDGDEGHSDLSVEYHFDCAQPRALDQLQLTAFKHWPRIHQMDVAVVGDRGQKAARLRATSPKLNW